MQFRLKNKWSGWNSEGKERWADRHQSGSIWLGAPDREKLGDTNEPWHRDVRGFLKDSESKAHWPMG